MTEKKGKGDGGIRSTTVLFEQCVYEVAVARTDQEKGGRERETETETGVWMAPGSSLSWCAYNQVLHG